MPQFFFPWTCRPSSWDKKKESLSGCWPARFMKYGDSRTELVRSSSHEPQTTSCTGTSRKNIFRATGLVLTRLHQEIKSNRLPPSWSSNSIQPICNFPGEQLTDGLRLHIWYIHLEKLHPATALRESLFSLAEDWRHQRLSYVPNEWIN